MRLFIGDVYKNSFQNDKFEGNWGLTSGAREDQGAILPSLEVRQCQLCAVRPIRFPFAIDVANTLRASETPIFATYLH